MKRAIVLGMIVVLVGLGITLAMAQDPAMDRADKTSMVERTKTYLQWMKAMADKLEQELEQARREQNSRKIDCIEDRLVSLKKVIAESDGQYQKLRAMAMQQRTSDEQKIFAKIDLNRRLAEQILKLVNNCYENINEEGGFVETVEEWIGDPEQEMADDPTRVEDRDAVPEPVPSEFTPGPVSEETEEF